MRRRLSLIIVAVLLTYALALSSHAEQSKKPITSLDDLAQPGISIAVGLDTPAEASLQKDYPGAKLIPYSDIFLAYLDVANGRIDACVNARREMEFAIDHGFTGVRLLDENYTTNKIAVGISPVSPIPDLKGRLNTFIAEKKSDGTLDEMYDRWITRGEEIMPELPEAESPAFTLCVGTTGTVMPYSYYVGTELAGYDIELARRFAHWLGAKLEFKVYDFGGIIAAAESGSIDCIMSNLFYTDEKDEAIPFSDVLFEVEITAMVCDNGQTSQTADTVTSAVYTALSQLNGKRIGVQTGTSFDAIVSEILPEAQIDYYNTKADLVAALTGNKVDGFVVDEPVAQLLTRENAQITYLPEYLDDYAFAFVFPKTAAGEALRDQFNAFLRQLPEGTLDALAAKWFGEDEDAKTMPDIKALSGENGTLRLATESGYAPFEYVRDGAVVGYDMELAALFCENSGYGLEIVDMNFDGILPAVQTRKCDFAAAGISITPEREESVLFSEPNYTGGTVMAVLKADAAAESQAASGEGWHDYNGKRAGVITGSFHDSVIAEWLPDSDISQYNNYSDMIAALKTNKIDYFLASTEIAGSLMEADDALEAFTEPVLVLDIGAMFARTEKGDALRAQMDAFIERIQADGTLEEIYHFWSDPANESTPVDMSGLTGENGTLQFATSGTKVPISFVANGQIAGTDPDIAVRFCREYGYGIEVNIVETAGIIPGIVTGMYDFSLSDMVITEERKESVSFSIPYHGTELLMLTRSGDTIAARDDSAMQEGFIDRLKTSFNKTFIREGRWKLFLQGVLTTLLITALTILFGTALGFLVFMLCRNGNPVANLITRFSLWLVQGMPMVVLLMILYYIIFGSVAINGIVVAVIGFTLTFGAAVYGLLKMGVGAVDNGQYEAAYALGYTNHRTFFRIILPQALPHVLPAYKGEIVGLIKATAIVGYIAVQDLTKMGDIVRSRTYEAFFPLIAVTIIYFVLEGLIGFLVSRISINFNPKRRKPADILKGVKTDD